MLLEVADVTLHIASFLDGESLGNFALSNRALRTLLRPLVLRQFTVGWYRWPRGGDQVAVLALLELLVLLKDDERISCLKHLRLLNHEKWMKDEGMMEKVAELVKKADLQVIDIAQPQTTVDDLEIPFDWAGLWDAIISKKSLRSLRLSWHRGRINGIDGLECLEELTVSCYNLDYFSVWPPALRSLTFDNLNVMYEQTEFPSGLFGTLEKLTLIDCERPFCRKLYKAIKVYLDDPSNPPLALQYIRLDLHANSMLGSLDRFPDIMGTKMHFRDYAKLFSLLAAAPNMKHVSLGSTPTLNFDRKTNDWHSTSRVISYDEAGNRVESAPPAHGMGLDGEPVSDVSVVDGLEELCDLLSSLPDWFPHLETLGLLVGPRLRTPGYPKMSLQRLILLTDAIGENQGLQDLKTNLSLDDEGVAELFGKEKQPSNTIATVRLFFHRLPDLGTLSLTTSLFHPIENWQGPPKRDQGLEYWPYGRMDEEETMVFWPTGYDDEGYPSRFGMSL